jgi:glycosyltransferase involved in cell wall biosynthesis
MFIQQARLTMELGERLAPTYHHWLLGWMYMKIFVVVHEFTMGGSKRIALRLGREWQASGAEVIIVSGAATGPLRDFVGDCAVICPESEIPRGKSRSSFARFVLGAVRRERPDVVFLPGNYYFELAGWLRLLGRKRPLVIGKASNTVVRKGERPIKARLRIKALGMKARLLDMLVVTLPAFVEEAQELLEIPDERLRIIRQPVLDKMPETVLEKHRSGLVAAGRLLPQKNYVLLLEALAKVPQRPRLRILGDGELRSVLQEKALELGVSEQVVFEGYVPDVIPIIGEAEILVSSSNYEGFGSVIIEAFAAGTPVIVTDCGASMRALVDDPEVGTVVPVGDANALAAAITQRLAMQTPDRNKLVARASPFLLKDAAAVYLIMFKSLVAKRPYDLYA